MYNLIFHTLSIISYPLDYPFPEYTREIGGFVCKDSSELIQCKGIGTEPILECLWKAKPLCDNDMNCFGLSSDSRHYIQLMKITIAKCTSKRLTRKFENGRWVGVLDGGFIMKKEKGREKIFVSIYG